MKRNAIKLTFVAVAAIGASALIRPAARYYSRYRSGIGVQLMSVGDSGINALGQPSALFARDSATFVFVVDAACRDCGTKSPSYAEFAKWASIQRVATRWIVVDTSAVKAVAEQARAFASVVHLPASWAKQHGIGELPSVLLLDRDGRVRSKWIGWTPRQRDAMPALQQLAD